jgi:hypothetical protein
VLVLRVPSFRAHTCSISTSISRAFEPFVERQETLIVATGLAGEHFLAGEVVD